MDETTRYHRLGGQKDGGAIQGHGAENPIYFYHTTSSTIPYSR